MRAASLVLSLALCVAAMAAPASINGRRYTIANDHKLERDVRKLDGGSNLATIHERNNFRRPVNPADLAHGDDDGESSYHIEAESMYSGSDTWKRH